MPNTVSKILLLDSFEDARLIAGKTGTERVVSGAALMEVPDIFPYLKKDVLLLTTLFPIANDEKRLAEFIAKLADCGIAGVCIKPHRYVDAIPPYMIDQANELGFPIVELPESANLSTMANEVLTLSLNENIAQMQYRTTVHQTLMELLLKDSSLNDLARSLAMLVQEDAFILDKDLTCLAAANAAGTSIHAKLALAQSETEDIRKNKGLLLTNKHLCPIVAGKRRFGYIYTRSKPARIDEGFDMAIGQASMLLASHFLKADAVAKNQKNFRDVFIRDLLSGSITSPLEVEKKTSAFSMSLAFPQPVACIKAFSESDSATSAFYDGVINSELIDVTYAQFSNRVVGPIYRIYVNDMVVMLGCNDHPSKLAEYFKEILGDLEALVPEAEGDILIGVGISDASQNALSLSTAYDQAVSTLETGTVLNKQSFVDTYDSRRIFFIIEHVKDPRVLERFVRDKIGALIDHDAEKGTQLMETLGMLIAGNLNYRQVAESSFVHYNTIRYRAAKIEQLGVSLKHGRDFAEIVVAYDCWIWLKAIGEAPPDKKQSSAE